LNAQYSTRLPPDLAARLDAEAAQEGADWRSIYKLAIWLGLVAIEDRGSRAVEVALGEASYASSVGDSEWRAVKVPPEARELVSIAKRDGMEWQRILRVAVLSGLATIEARGGLAETRRQINALRRSVVSQATMRAA
jgi:hypothetical protein